MSFINYIIYNEKNLNLKIYTDIFTISIYLLNIWKIVFIILRYNKQK